MPIKTKSKKSRKKATKQTHAIAEPLTKPEKQQLRKLERTIKKGWDTFVDVGKALSEIRDSRLYRENFKSFESYCRTQFGYSRGHAYRLIGAAEVIDDLSPLGDKSRLPQAETHVRPLIDLKPEERKSVWEFVLESSDGTPITAKTVKQAVAQKVPAKSKASAKPKRVSRLAKARSLVDQALNAFNSDDRDKALKSLQDLQLLLA